MSTHKEKIIFGFLGAVTAIIVGIGVYFEFEKPPGRTPASQQEQLDPTPYPYFFD